MAYFMTSLSFRFLPRGTGLMAVVMALTLAEVPPAPAQEADTAPSASRPAISEEEYDALYGDDYVDEYEAIRGADVDDPWEGVNRSIFSFNMAADEYVMQPVARTYRDNLPEGVRRTIGNMLRNAASPVVLLNDLLQGEWGRAKITFNRMITNTVEGMGGMVDVAEKRGLHSHSEDFGQTLAVWGVSDGPYLMLPLFGPSNPRDTVGLVVTGFMNPIAYSGSDYVTPSMTVAETVDTRSQTLDVLEEIKQTSLDFYATVRSLHSQRRLDEIRNGRPSNEIPMPGMFVVPGSAPASDTPAEPRENGGTPSGWINPDGAPEGPAPEGETDKISQLME